MNKLLIGFLFLSVSALAKVQTQITNPSLTIYEGLNLEAKKTEEDSQMIIMTKEVGPLRCDEYIYKNGETNNYGCALKYDVEKSISDENRKIYESIKADAQDWMSDHVDGNYKNESKKSVMGLTCSRITLNESGTHRELSKPKFTCTLEL